MSNTKYLETIKSNFLTELINKIKEAGANEVELMHPILYYECSDESVVIRTINAETKKLNIDNGWDSDQWESLDHLNIEKVAELLDEIEEGNFEIYEELSDEEIT